MSSPGAPMTFIICAGSLLIASSDHRSPRVMFSMAMQKCHVATA
jgi:hypothetical protein